MAYLCFNTAMEADMDSLKRRYLGQRHCLGHSKQMPFFALKNG